MVTDDNAIITSCSPAIPHSGLAPNAEIICQAEHYITQADINAGFVNNQAIAAATDPTGNPVVDSSDDPSNSNNSDPNNDGNPDDPTQTLLTLSPTIEVVKTSMLDLGPDGVASVGDVINYTITTTNTGNVTLDNVMVTDDNAVITSCNPVIPHNGFAPNTQIVCQAVHSLTQTDINTGFVLNQAIAAATDPQGNPIVDSSDDPANSSNSDPNSDGNPDDPTRTPLVTLGSLEITKSASIDLGSDNAVDIGDIISYTLLVTNIGNTTLNQVSVSDDNAVITSCSRTLPLDDFTPGTVITCMAEHAITQEDINAGRVENQARANALDPSNNPITDTSDDPSNPSNSDPNSDGNPDDPTVTTFSTAPSISLTKTGLLDLGPDGIATVGDVITYTITATNTGNVSLTTVTILDENASITSCSGNGTLASGESLTCNAVHSITQDEINAGFVLNQASVAALDPQGNPVVDTSDDPSDSSDNDSNNDGNPDDPTRTDIEAPPPVGNPAITVNKLGILDVGDNGVGDVGEAINYAITIINSGDTVLNNVTLTDNNAVIGTCTPALPANNVAVGDVIRCSAVHALTAADIAAGTVSNQAIASATRW